MNPCASAFIACTMGVGLTALFSFPVHALTSADALPRGVRAAAFVYGEAPAIDSTFDADGKLDYLVSPLNRSISFEELAEFEPDLKKLKNVIDSIYPQRVGNQLLQAELYADADVREQRYVPALLWGLTDRWSIGAVFPITKRTIRASFDAKVINQGASLRRLVGEIPALKEAAQQLASAQVDTALFAEKIFAAHGYQTPGALEKRGLGDIEAELRYRYFENSWLGLGARLNLKMPTGNSQADISNLLDRPIGAGNYSLKLGLLQDIKPLGPRWIISSAFFVTRHFASQDVRAIRKDPEQLLPNLNDPYQIETVRKQRGWDFSSDVAISRGLFRNVVWLGFSYVYAYHGSDRYEGARDLNYAELASNTQTEEHGFEYSLELSSIQLFLDELFPLPAKLVFAWYEPIKGRNALYAPYGRMDFALLF